MRGAPQVRAVVVSWNGAHLLPPCLASLAAQRGPFDLEVVVVDNDSSDGTAELLRREHPDVTPVVAPSNLGFAGGVALATRDWTGDFVLLLNNDATLAPDGLAQMLAHLTSPGHERVGAVTAKILLDGWFRPEPGSAPAPPPGSFRRDGTTLVRVAPDAPGAVRVVNSTGNLLTRDGAGVDRDWLAVDGTETGGREVLGFCGGAALLRRTALDEAGGFDADLFLYYEDTDVSWRMRSAGWRIEYVPQAVAHHQHAASSGTASPVFRYYNTRNSLVVVGRHAPASVVLRSAARQTAGLLRAAVRRSEPRELLAARGRGLRDALVRAPRTARERRALARAARVPRSEIAQQLV